MTAAPTPAWRAVFWLAALAVLLALHRGDPLNSDDGLVLAGAWDMWLGRLIYRDFFVWTAPGAFYSVWAAWLVTGPSWETAKALGIASVLLSAWAIVRTAALFTPSGRAYVPAAIFVVLSVAWPIVSYNVLSIPWLAWAVYFGARGCIDARPATFVLAGLASGAGVLYLQHRGLAVAGATAAFCAVQALRVGPRWLVSLAWFTAGFVPPLLLLLRWEPALVAEALFIFPWERYQPDATHRGPFVTYASVWMLVLGMAWTLRRRMTAALAYVLTVQAVLLAAAYRSWDWSHISFALFPLFAALPALDWSPPPAAGVSPRLWRLLVATYYGGLAGSTAAHAAHTAFVTQRVPEARTLPLVRFIERECSGSRYLWAGPFIAGVYFYTRTVNPTRFSILFARQNRPEHVAEARDALDRVRPPCVVVNHRVGSQWHTTDNDVDRFIAAHYRPAFTTGDTTVLVRADGRRTDNLSSDPTVP
ncbi:MAG TPA: hypothetical protein VNO26_13425 [Candidatus Limnocylindria bacterium]|nr:hypothetical protein [Candidatus Limnocylindria bacterium]